MINIISLETNRRNRKKGWEQQQGKFVWNDSCRNFFFQILYHPVNKSSCFGSEKIKKIPQNWLKTQQNALVGSGFFQAFSVRVFSSLCCFGW